MTLPLPADAPLETTSIANTSAQDAGYRWVAEWEPHEATWISWPHSEKTWPGRFHTIPPATERMIRILAEVEHVHVVGGPPAIAAQARNALANVSNVTVHDIPTDDCWIRDYGPTFVLSADRRRLGAVRWRFNAWGNKYPHERDAQVSGILCQGLDAYGKWHANAAPSDESLQAFVSQMVCEGGALETDGQGTLMATSSSILSSTRNAHWPRMLVESELKRMLGVTHILWVDGGVLAGDDTDSHIDQLVRFVRPGVVLAAVSYSADDSNAIPLDRQRGLLDTMVDAAGRALQVIPLVTPPPRLIQGRRVPESYCNFLIANEIVLMPSFGFRETDDRAAGILREHFSDRNIVPLDASDFIWGLGAFHCATQQQPAVSQPTGLNH